MPLPTASAARTPTPSLVAPVPSSFCITPDMCNHLAAVLPKKGCQGSATSSSRTLRLWTSRSPTRHGCSLGYLQPSLSQSPPVHFYIANAAHWVMNYLPLCNSENEICCRLTRGALRPACLHNLHRRPDWHARQKSVVLLT